MDGLTGQQLRTVLAVAWLLTCVTVGSFYGQRKGVTRGEGMGYGLLAAVLIPAPFELAYIIYRLLAG